MALSKQAREWYNLLVAEARRQRRNEGKREVEQASLPIVYDRIPAHMREVPVTPPEVPPMSLPACLMRGDTEASRERRAVVLTREFWLQGSMPKQTPAMPTFVIRNPVVVGRA